MRVLLVGLGRWGEKHARVLRELGVTLWGADLSVERRRWAAQAGLAPERIVADYRLALPHVDAVVVATPAPSHAAITEAALRAGRDCFVEKPLAVTAADGRRLAALAGASGRVLQVGHIFRFHPVTALLREALAAGRLGRVRYLTGRFAGFKRPRTDVGVTHTDAIHYFDLFAHLLGRRATAVAALQRDYLGRGLDDLSVTIVHFGDIPAVVEANYFLPGTWRECAIVGERATLLADYAASTVVVHECEHRPVAAGWEAVERGKEHLVAAGPEPLRCELEAFLAACAGRAAAPVTGEDGVAALEVVEAAARAARLGRLVRLDRRR